MPDGMDLLGMAVVSGITDALGTAGNIMQAPFKLVARLSRVGMDAYKTRTEPEPPAVPTPLQNTNPAGVDTVDAEAALADPALSTVAQTLTYALAVEAMLGPANGKPDWATITSTNLAKPGGATFVQVSLQQQQKCLAPAGPISKALAGPVGALIAALQYMLSVATSADGSEARALDSQYAPVHDAVAALKAVAHTANVVTQQTGQHAKGPGTPGTPAGGNTSAMGAKLALENAHFAVDSTRANMQTARASYDNAADRLIAGQEALTASIAEVTKVVLEGATLERYVALCISDMTPI
jgi:hypothetical protein